MVNNISQYTLLLVDDEEDVIQIMLHRMPWETLGFSVIGHANNGVKACEIIEEYQPDVVMTDIKMPYMDGLELCNYIRNKYPATHILLFTGFDEFEYAKEAVHLEIEEYILKPSNASELAAVFAGLKVKLDQEISERKSVAVLQEYYMSSLPQLQANLYSALIEGRIHEEELKKSLANYQIEFKGSLFCCLVIYVSKTIIPKDMDERLLMPSVDKQAREQLEQRWGAKSFPYLDNTVMIAQLKNGKEITELTDECDRFCKYIYRAIGAVVTIGVGQYCRNIVDLWQSYHGAKEAVSYRVLYGGKRAINIQEIIPRKRELATTDSGDGLSELLKMISFGSEAEISHAIEVYLDKIYEQSGSLQEHQIVMMELISRLYRFAANNSLVFEEGAAVSIGDYLKLINMEKSALEQWLNRHCLLLHESIQQERDSSTQSLIQRAKEYAHSHYQDECLSLDDVCKLLGISNSYFSSVFKKHTGNSFISYLTTYRMEKAVRMLVETTEKSYVIAKSVGYTDANYFSYVFKRQYGISPSRYRSEHGKSE